jgi:acetoin utilization deacetylase AcuC-like enzyme
MKFVVHPRATEHVQWAGHPERPERVKAIVDRVRAEKGDRAFVTPHAATKRDLLRVHDEAFVEKIRSAPEGPYDADTFLHKGTYALALLSAGAALAAARGAVKSKEEYFAVTRPPGHHAGTSFAGGFCYFNNAAIAAHYLAVDAGLAPVAIVDLDVHHGNGTQDIFAHRKEVVYLSTHQWGLFPGTGAETEVGEGAGRGRIVNVPLPAGSGDSTFELAWRRVFLPVLEAAKPKAVVVSLGIDAHYDDPLAGLTLSSPGYIEMCLRVAKFARETAKAPAVFMLEGGYSLPALAETVAGLAAALEGREALTTLNEVRDGGALGESAVERAVKVQSRSWGIEHAAKAAGRKH